MGSYGGDVGSGANSGVDNSRSHDTNESTRGVCRSCCTRLECTNFSLHGSAWHFSEYSSSSTVSSGGYAHHCGGKAITGGDSGSGNGSAGCSGSGDDGHNGGGGGNSSNRSRNSNSHSHGHGLNHSISNNNSRANRNSNQSVGRRRLSSTGDVDTWAGASSYEGSSDSSENSDESRLEPVTRIEREQLETFFRGLKSQVFVCESLANLYLGSASQTEGWKLRFTGIPIVVLDLGETRSRSKRRIQILLAERGTCFTLWRETIDNLTSYKVSGPAFHTMCLSSDHTQIAGLSFDNPKAANDLWQHIERLVSCPENISLSIPGKKKKKKPLPKRLPLPSKSNISQPCQFQHVTSVDAADRCRYLSLQTLVPPLNDLPNSLEANF